MKKYKEWLKEAVGELNSVDTVFEADGVSYIDTAVSVMKVYDLIDQLEDSEKVVIPKFVADWIEEMKQDERPLYSVMSSLMNKTNHEWAIWKSANMNFSEIVAQAWLGGWLTGITNEVEKEKLYQVIIPTKDKLWKYYYLDDDGGINMVDGLESVESHTEEFIRSVSDDLWAFAVEVEG